MLTSYLCDHSDGYIVVKGSIDILAVAANENDKAEKDVAIKNNAFRSYISKIDSKSIDNVEQRNMLKDMDFYHLQKNMENSSWIQGYMLPKK